MSNTNKKSINTYFSELIDLVIETHPNLSDEQKKDYKDFLSKRIEVNSKKNAGTKKQTATQVANNALGTAIVEYLKSTNKSMTIGEMMKEIPECEDLSNQKINGVIRYLYDSEKNPNPNPALVRTEEKGKAYFRYNANYKVEEE